MARGNLARAADFAQRCLELAEGNEARKNIVKGRRLRAQVLMAHGQLDEAERDLAVALEFAHEVGNPPQLWETQAAIGALRLAQGRAKEASKAYADAMSVIDAVAGTLSDQELRRTFLSSARIKAIRSGAT
jgi:tetratricopeptide (TPR) repeat protein